MQVHVNTWGRCGVGAFTVDAPNTESFMPALREALKERNVSVDTLHGEGIALRNGKLEAYHYAGHAEVFDEDTAAIVVVGDVWISVNAPDFDALPT